MKEKKVNEKKDNQETSSAQEQVKEQKENQQAEMEQNQTSSELPPVEEAAKEAGESIDELKASINNERDRYLRLMAEFDNYKKRISRDYDKLVEAANEKLILDLVDVRENFDRAIKSGESATEVQSLLDGLKLIYNKFAAALEKNGLEIFADIGESFDPQLHDALMKTPHPSIPEDHITEVYEKGYKLKGKVIKHAKVIVSSGTPES